MDINNGQSIYYTGSKIRRDLTQPL